MRWAARQDVVHKPIVAALESHSITVYLMPDPGDVLTYGLHRTTQLHIWLPMELKSGNDVRKKKADGSEELSPRQQRMREKRFRAPIPIVHSEAEALALYGIKVSAA
jgi:hypothetical protein